MPGSEPTDSRRTFLARLSAICALCGLPIPFQPEHARESREAAPETAAFPVPCARCATCTSRFCRYR
jgi:hypothetical protein